MPGASVALAGPVVSRQRLGTKPNNGGARMTKSIVRDHSTRDAQGGLVIAKPKPTTVKGLSKADRDLMNGAARRAQQTLGQWLAETARLRVASERVGRIDGAAPARLEPVADTPRHERPGRMQVAELAALMRELPDLARAPRCGGIALKVRQVLHVELDQYLPPAAARRRRATSSDTTRLVQQEPDGEDDGEDE